MLGLGDKGVAAAASRSLVPRVGEGGSRRAPAFFRELWADVAGALCAVQVVPAFLVAHPACTALLSESISSGLWLILPCWLAQDWFQATRVSEAPPTPRASGCCTVGPSSEDGLGGGRTGLQTEVGTSAQPTPDT